MRILLVEDEIRLSQSIKSGLVREGFAVDQSHDGLDGLYLAESEKYDVIVLDVALPNLNGIEICRRLRAKKITTPILMLTALSQLDDKVLGLDAGADDYLTKPFAFAELKSRIQAILRRSYHTAESVMKIEDLEIDPLKHIVKRDDKIISLTPKEFALLEFLARRKGEVVTRTQIIEHTWDYNFDNMSNVVDVFIASLRKKIDDRHKGKLIQTIRGVGFTLSENTQHE